VGVPEFDPLGGMCPLCGATLKPAAHAADVLGYGLFDVGLGLPADLGSRRRSAGKRSSDERGGTGLDW
jgi:hypothetical protein